MNEESETAFLWGRAYKIVKMGWVIENKALISMQTTKFYGF